MVRPVASDRVVTSKVSISSTIALASRPRASGQPISSEQAFEFGLVNRICEPGKLLEEALATAQAIADNAPLSVRQAKRSIHYGLDMDLPPSADDPRMALVDHDFPDGHCGTMTIRFPVGPQHLAAAQVLQYARSRYSTDDFDRNRRQQDVLVALKERLLKLDMIIAAKLVDGVDEAIAHIKRYGSQHTESILTENDATAARFFQRLDSAILMRNASTQFADGGEFGMGAEIGIATGKMHARGPVGAEQLTSFKYLVTGDGTVRA